MRIHVRDGSPIRAGNEDFQQTSNLTYFSSIVSVIGGTEEDLTARVKKTQQALACLRAVWKARSLSLKTRLRIFNSNVKTVLLYVSKTWPLTKALLSKVQTFVNKRLAR